MLTYIPLLASLAFTANFKMIRSLESVQIQKADCHEDSRAHPSLPISTVILKMKKAGADVEKGYVTYFDLCKRLNSEYVKERPIVQVIVDGQAVVAVKNPVAPDSPYDARSVEISRSWAAYAA